MGGVLGQGIVASGFFQVQVADASGWVANMRGLQRICVWSYSSRVVMTTYPSSLVKAFGGMLQVCCKSTRF